MSRPGGRCYPNPGRLPRAISAGGLRPTFSLEPVEPVCQGYEEGDYYYDGDGNYGSLLCISSSLHIQYFHFWIIRYIR